MKKLIGLLVAALALATIAWSQGALSINGAGATFPYPMYSKWFDEYHKLHPDIQINYKRVTLVYSTHSEGGLTEKDFAGAAMADRIAAR